MKIEVRVLEHGRTISNDNRQTGPNSSSRYVNWSIICNQSDFA